MQLMHTLLVWRMQRAVYAVVQSLFVTCRCCIKTAEKIELVFLTQGTVGLSCTILQEFRHLQKQGTSFSKLVSHTLNLADFSAFLPQQINWHRCRKLTQSISQSVCDSSGLYFWLSHDYLRRVLASQNNVKGVTYLPLGVRVQWKHTVQWVISLVDIWKGIWP